MSGITNCQWKVEDTQLSLRASMCNISKNKKCEHSLFMEDVLIQDAPNCQYPDNKQHLFCP